MRQVKRGKGGEGRGKSNGAAQRKHRMEQEEGWEGGGKPPGLYTGSLDPKPLGWPEPALSSAPKHHLYCAKGWGGQFVNKYVKYTG